MPDSVGAHGLRRTGAETLGVIPNNSTAGRAGGREAMLVGTKATVPVPWDKSRPTLVAAITTTCPHCAESLPFYRQIAALSQKPGAAFTFVVASPESPEAVNTLLSMQHVVPTRVLQTSFAHLNVTATPTLLLIDSTGTIERAFIGQLPHSREAELLKLLEHE